MILPAAQLLLNKEIAMFGLTSLGLLRTAIAVTVGQPVSYGDFARDSVRLQLQREPR
jgi:hypothetical protein